MTARVLSAMVVAVVGVAVAVPSSVFAEGGANGGTRPQPQRLWHAYPLNPPHSGSAPTSGTRRPTSGTTLSDARTKGSGGGVSPSLWGAVAGALLAVLFATSVLARRRRSAAPTGDVSVGTSSSRRQPLRAVPTAVARRSAGSSPANARLVEPPREVVAERVKPARTSSGVTAVAAEDEALTREVAAAGTEPTPRRERGKRPVVRVAGAGVERTDTAALKQKDVVRTARPAALERIGSRPPSSPAPPRVAALEQATLKQKQAAAHTDEVARIKAKADALSSLKEAKDRDVTKLKAKLVERPEKTAVSAESAEKASGRDTLPVPQRRAASAETPSDEPATNERRPAAKRVQPGHCRIEWWRGYVKSEFCANMQLPDGRESTLRSSPPFRWRKATPPPKDLPQAAQAHETLVRELIADGWVVSGGGSDWWALELKEQAGRRSTIERPEGAT